MSEVIKVANAAMAEDAPRAALEILTRSRKQPRWRLHRQELLRDLERVMSETAAGWCETMLQATARVCDHASIVGAVTSGHLRSAAARRHRIRPRRGARVTHFGGEPNAQAKLFYATILRPPRSLPITGTQNFVQLPVPRL